MSCNSLALDTLPKLAEIFNVASIRLSSKSISFKKKNARFAAIKDLLSLLYHHHQLTDAMIAAGCGLVA
jgi:hypothetical protein